MAPRRREKFRLGIIVKKHRQPFGCRFFIAVQRVHTPCILGDGLIKTMRKTDKAGFYVVGRGYRRVHKQCV